MRATLQVLNTFTLKEIWILGFPISHYINISVWAESVSWWLSKSSTKVEREPKFFFVSTSSTTSTLQTARVCYVLSGTPTTCTGKKLRLINTDHSPLADSKTSQLNQEVQSSWKKEKLDREGSFFLYWITTTSIFPSTKWAPMGVAVVTTPCPSGCKVFTEYWVVNKWLPSCYQVTNKRSKIYIKGLKTSLID